MNDVDVLGTAQREAWMWSNTDLHEIITQLWHAYADGADVTLTPQHMRAALVTLADATDRMEREFWEGAHEA
jgi:hypothetical protein